MITGAVPVPDFRFEGITPGGRMVQGVVQAQNLQQAKKMADDLARSRGFSIKQFNPKRVFIYRAQKPGEQPVSGQQKAYTENEVQGALERLGYKVIYVRKKLFDFKMAPPNSDIVSFVRVSSDLLREKLSLADILQILVMDIENPTLREAVREINSDLHQGIDSEDAFTRQEQVLGRFTARMLGLASKSGNMADIYESTATFLERSAEFKKAIRQALMMPLFTLLILFGAVIFYVAYIFPQTAEMFVKMNTALPPMTAKIMQFSDFLKENMLLLCIVTVVLGIVIFTLTRLPGYPEWKDKWMLRLPVMGPLVHKTTIEIFCRVLYALYSGSGESIDAIRLASEASGNSYFEKQVKTVSIPMMLGKGIGLVPSLEASGVFTKMALNRFHSGAETGTIRQTALQIANYYQKETVYKLKNIVDLIQVVVAMIIMAVMTALTLVSTETANIRPGS